LRHAAAIVPPVVAMKRLLVLLLLAGAALAGVLGFNAWRARPLAVTIERLALPLDEAALARRLAAAIAIPTLSPTRDAPALDAFHALQAQLAADFPRTHAGLERETVNGASLLYRWPGRAACAPLLLAAHQDVVPIEPGTESDWTHAPFSGAIADGYVWGRGAIDDKASLLAILEAVEHLLGTGFVPACPVWLAFGHDEEVGGDAGAKAIAARLQARGVVPAFVLDEGGALTQGTFAGLDVPLATIGVAEKGYLSVRLSARGEGGHSSMPPRHSAIGRVAAAVARLEADRPAAALGAVQRELLARVAPHLPFGKRLVLANLWISGPLVESLLGAVPASDATLRTTTAPTMFHAGVKDNVLAQQAEAIVNFRIRPGDSIAGVLAHVRAAVDDPQVEVEAYGGFGSEPTAPAPWDNAAFALIESALRSASAEAQLVVAPYVTNGATDARHYAALTPNLYRFAPFKLMPDELAAFHGTDERIAITEHARAVRFYVALLRGFGADAR
jgi:carboxypeptidase PM20D1